MGCITTFRAGAVAALIGLALLPVPPRASLASFGDPVIVGAADIGSCGGSGDDATARLIDAIPGTVMAAGDLAYDKGTAAQFANCFGPSWGRFRDRIRPAPGNRDYYTADAGPYFDYFGSLAGTRGQGWYSYDVGTWHVVVLNSNCSYVGCSAGSSQENWLRADLAAAHARCVLAYFHHPLYGSFNTGTTTVKSLWQALYDYRASVVVNGHIHGYERFAPQDPRGNFDPNGIRQFIAGTGGGTLISGSHSSNVPNSEARDNTSHGVLKLTLHPESYDWQFIPVAGKSYTDGGSTACSSGSPGGGTPPPPPPPPPGGGTPPPPPPPPPGSSWIFEPVADATVSARDPYTNSATSRSLTVDSDPASEAYLRFSVSGLPGVVRRATLRLYVSNGSQDGPAAYPTSTEWSEQTITWYQRPFPTGYLVGDLGRVKKGAWVSFDVSAVVRGDGIYAFELAPTSSDGTKFSSRDAKSKRPQLVVETTTEPVTTTTTTTTWWY
jgi:calcineurin-like phosphoesterase family protein